MSTITDDGPGRDQYGPHDGPAYFVDPREMVGLPAPDAPAIAAELAEHSLLTAKEDEALDTRVQGLLRDRELGYASRRATSQKIIAAVREADRGASHEGATVSAPVDANAVYGEATTCVCRGLIEEIDSGNGHSYWAHVKRMRIEYDHAAVPALSSAAAAALTAERFGPVGGDR